MAEKKRPMSEKFSGDAAQMGYWRAEDFDRSLIKKPKPIKLSEVGKQKTKNVKNKGK